MLHAKQRGYTYWGKQKIFTKGSWKEIKQKTNNTVKAVLIVMCSEDTGESFFKRKFIKMTTTTTTFFQKYR